MPIKKKDEKPYIETLCKWAQKDRREHLFPITMKFAERARSAEKLSRNLRIVGLSADAAAVSMRDMVDAMREPFAIPEGVINPDTGPRTRLDADGNPVSNPDLEGEWCPFTMPGFHYGDRRCSINKSRAHQALCSGSVYKTCHLFKAKRLELKRSTKDWLRKSAGDNE